MSMFNVSDGYVAYSEPSKWIGFGVNWEMVRQATARQAESVMASIGSLSKQDFIDTGSFLIGLGESEFQKEAALVNKFFPNYIASVDDLSTFVKNFNQILSGAEVFDRAVRNLERAFSERKVLKNDAKSDTDYRQQLAPLISSLYKGSFVKVFAAKVNAIVQQHASVFQTGDISSLMAALEQAYEESIIEGFEDSINNFSLENDSYFGEQGDYRELLDAMNQFSHLSESFKQLIRTRIPFDKIFNQLQASATNIYKNRNRTQTIKGKVRSASGVYTAINDSVTSQVGSLGGFIHEIYNALTMSESITGTVTENGGVFQAITAYSNMQKTDGMAILSFDPTMTEERLLQLLQDGPQGTQFDTLLDAAQGYIDFNNNVLSKLKDSFVIYTNAKAYGLGTNFRGFSNDSERKLSQLPSVAIEDPGAAQNLVWAAYNSLQGAVLSGQQSTIIENIKILLAKSMAKLFFDDWTTIGNQMAAGSSNSLHVFALEGVQVPLSALLIKAGQAMQEASSHFTSYFRAEVHLPDGILYPGSGHERWSQYPFVNSSHITREAIENAWELQRNAVEAGSSFSTHFLGGFFNFLGGLGIGNYG